MNASGEKYSEKIPGNMLLLEPGSLPGFSKKLLKFFTMGSVTPAEYEYRR